MSSAFGSVLKYCLDYLNRTISSMLKCCMLCLEALAVNFKAIYFSFKSKKDDAASLWRRLCQEPTDPIKVNWRLHGLTEQEQGV